MNFIDMLKMRRSVYNLNKQLPISHNQVVEMINDAVRYVPDAFNMQSQRVLILFGEQNDKFWNGVYDVLCAATGEQLSRDRIDSFRSGYGTILYFYDSDIVEKYKNQFSVYADNFNNWANQSNAMLQFAIWTGLASVNIGASLQHYNPIIDDMVHKMFSVPDSWVLNAQMPFGGIAVVPEQRMDRDITLRVKISE